MGHGEGKTSGGDETHEEWPSVVVDRALVCRAGFEAHLVITGRGWVVPVPGPS